MCGIAGGIGLNPNARPDRRRVEAMSAGLSHRGPDGSGLWIAPSGRAILAHRRLAVIDLDTGQQPMLDRSGTAGIVFNGEIYNYRELRQDLELTGQQFSTRSDTEVLLRLLTVDGARTLPTLRGMFAFAYWDDRHRTLLLARDRIGKKPLFYTVEADCLYFASGLDALCSTGITYKDIDLNALDLFLTLGYIPAPLSIYQGIYKLAAGTFTTVASDATLATTCFWDPAGAAKRYEGSYQQALDELQARLERSVSLRLRSDVPLGIFLSGGIDSSLVAAMAARQAKGDLQAFSVGFSESGFDESEFAHDVAHHLGLHHHILRAEVDLLDGIPSINGHFGEPYADSSALALFAIAGRARPHITVALGGDGGDEGFAGYGWYHNARRLARLARLLPANTARSGAKRLRRLQHRGHLQRLSRLGRFQRGLTILGLCEPERFAALRSFVNEAEAELIYAGELLERRRAGLNPARAMLSSTYRRSKGTALRQMRCVDIRTYLADDLMPKLDVATMAHGLEARAPLLDQEVIEFGLSLPDEFLVDHRGGKRILRDLLARHVPRMLFERRKQGFSVPLQAWFAGKLRPQLNALSQSERLTSIRLLKPNGIRRLVDEHEAGMRDHSQRLFTLLQLDRWLAQH